MGELRGAGAWDGFAPLQIVTLSVLLQVLQLRHRAERLQEAGGGVGCCVQGYRRVPGGRGEAAAQGRTNFRGSEDAPVQRGGFIPCPGAALPPPPHQWEGMKEHLHPRLLEGARGCVHRLCGDGYK